MITSFVEALDSGEYDHLSNKTEQLREHFKKCYEDTEELEDEFEEIKERRPVDLYDGHYITGLGDMQRLVLATRYKITLFMV